MPLVLTEQEMEKLISEVAEVQAAQAYFRDGIMRIDKKLDKIVEDHDDRIRELESFKDKQLGLLGLAAIFGSAITWVFDHLGKLFK